MYVQLRDGVEEEIAAATKETRRRPKAANAGGPASAAAQKDGAASSKAKYSRFDAEVTSLLLLCPRSGTHAPLFWPTGVGDAAGQRDLPGRARGRRGFRGLEAVVQVVLGEGEREGIA